MSIFNKLSTVAISAALLTPLPAFANSLDSDSADVTMTVGLFASITGLDDFVLSPAGEDGAANAIYSGSDEYNLESNGQVRVTLSGSDMSNGTDTIPTSYDLDGNGIQYDTASGVTHNAAHTVSATATLGDISDQVAGNYSSTITLTVSAL